MIRLFAGLGVVSAIVAGSWNRGLSPRSAGLLVAVGIGGWVLGDALWDVFDAADLALTSGWYVVVNVLYLLMYPVLFAALVRIASPRGQVRTLDSVIDAAILSLAGVLLLQVVVINPRLAAHHTVDRFSAIYPFGDALLLAAVGWLVFSHARRNASVWLLGISLAMLVGVDTAWETSQQFSLSGWDQWTNMLYPISYAVLGAAFVHPAAARLAERRHVNATELHPMRLAFLCAALGFIPVTAFLATRDDILAEVLTSALVVAIGIRLAVLMRAIQNAHRRFVKLAAAAPVGILESDAALNIVFANDAATSVIGRSAVGMTAEQLISDLVDERDQMLLRRCVASVFAGEPATVQARIRAADGVPRWIAWSAVPVRSGPGPFAGAFVSATDITAIKQAEQMRMLQATHDALTGLPNRRMLLDHLAAAITRLNRWPDPVAVLFLDLDGFKHVNDHHGHDAGDELLILVANRLLRAVRAEDTVARVGGDEFVIVLERVSDLANAAHIADKIIQATAEPANIAQGDVSVGASIGIAITADPNADPEDLIHSADTAMYTAKRAGGGLVRAHHDTGVRHEVPTIRGRGLRADLASTGD